MDRGFLVAALGTSAVLALTAAGCGGSRAALVNVSVPADRPPSPATWQRYPRFPARSCWARPFGTGVMRAAPSVRPAAQRSSVAAGVILRRLLDRLGDRRFVRRVELGAPPPIPLMHSRGSFAGLP